MHRHGVNVKNKSIPVYVTVQTTIKQTISKAGKQVKHINSVGQVIMMRPGNLEG